MFLECYMFCFTDPGSQPDKQGPKTFAESGRKHISVIYKDPKYTKGDIEIKLINIYYIIIRKKLEHVLQEECSIFCQI